MKKVTPKDIITQFYYKNEAPLSDVMVPEKITGDIRERKDAACDYFADLELKIKKDFELVLEDFLIVIRSKEDCETKLENAVIKAEEYRAEIKLAGSVPLIGPKPNLSVWIYNKKQAFFNNLYIDYYIESVQPGEYEDRIEITKESKNEDGKVRKERFVKENVFFGGKKKK